MKEESDYMTRIFKENKSTIVHCKFKFVFCALGIYEDGCIEHTSTYNKLKHNFILKLEP